jgi:heme oxygenase (mycobilin-producing)
VRICLARNHDATEGRSIRQILVLSWIALCDLPDPGGGIVVRSPLRGKIALSTVCRRRLREEVLSGRVAQLEKQAVGVLSRFVVANDMDAEVKRAFILRPHLVDGAAGFVRMDVLSPEDMPNEIWLMTYWADIASYRTWHKSHAYHESHAGIPKGLKLVPGSAVLRIFNLIAS